MYGKLYGYNIMMVHTHNQASLITTFSLPRPKAWLRPAYLHHMAGPSGSALASQPLLVPLLVLVRMAELLVLRSCGEWLTMIMVLTHNGLVL